MPFPNLKFKIKNLKFPRAFSLIELLVVISLLAVLAGIVLVSTNTSRTKSKDSVRKQALKAISAAIVAYKTDNKHWPPNDTGSRINEYSSSGGGNWLPDLEGTYIDKLPHDPINSTVTSSGGRHDCKDKSFIYCYWLSDDKKTFVLWAQLENLNDPEINTKTSAACQIRLRDIFTVDPEDYKLNYCLKSPQ